MYIATDEELCQPNNEEGHYDIDLFVIGARSGNYCASRFSPSYGAKAAICELEFHPICLEAIGGVGGTCVICGCASKNIFELGSSFGGELERMPEFTSGICLFLGANLRR